MFKKATVKDAKVRKQNVLVRVDYNVPMKDGKITDDLRIRASLPTIEHLIKKGARRVILISHLGRPEGKKVPELSLRPVAERLSELLPDKKVSFIDDVSGPDVEEAVEKTPVGGILLLENLRVPTFLSKMASLLFTAPTLLLMLLPTSFLRSRAFSLKKRSRR